MRVSSIYIIACVVTTLEIQSEEGFSQLRFAADDSDGLIGPQPGKNWPLAAIFWYGN